MRFLPFILVWVLFGCSKKQADTPIRAAEIDAAFFAVLETGLTPAILVQSKSKYLGLFAETNAPSHIAFATRNGPRSFKNGQKLNAAELEECWLLVWWTNHPPWVAYLQRKPLALSLDGDGLHLSFGKGAGDVVVMPLHGSATNVNTMKWPEFLTREPLLRIRYWAGVLREIPIACENSVIVTNQSITVSQKFRYHSIRDDWNTKPLKLAPMSAALAAAADEKLKRKLRELQMLTLSGYYTGIEGADQWEATFPLSNTVDTNCPSVSLGTIETNGWPRLHGSIKPVRDRTAPAAQIIPLNAHSRLITYQLEMSK